VNREIPALFFKGSIGDEICTTPIVRALYKEYNAKVVVNMSYSSQIYKYNPFVSFNTCFTKPIILKHPRQSDHSLHLVDYYAKLAGVNLESRTPELYLNKEDIVQTFVKNNGRLCIAMDTRCGSPIRQWPLYNFRHLTYELKQRNIDVIEVGKTINNCYGQSINHKLSNASISFLDKLSLRQTAYVISQCDLFVGCDSGLAHVAAAIGIKSVVLFGPISPLTRAHENTIPIFTNTCEYYNIQHDDCIRKDKFCTRSISVDLVKQIILRVLFKNISVQ